MSKVSWNPPDVAPRRRGWYRVRRVDDRAHKILFRAFGEGGWWSPRADGWLGCNGVYEWHPGRLRGIEPHGSKLTPIEEMESAQAIYKKRRSAGRET